MKDGRSLTQFSPVAEKMSSEASGLPGKISYGYSGLASTRKSVDIKAKLHTFSSATGQVTQRQRRSAE